MTHTKMTTPVRGGILAAIIALLALTAACSGNEPTAAPRASSSPSAAARVSPTASPSAASKASALANVTYDCPTSAEVATATGYAESEVPLESTKGDRDDGVDQAVSFRCKYTYRAKGLFERWTSPEGAGRALRVYRLDAEKIDATGLGDEAWFKIIGDHLGTLFVRRGSDAIDASYDSGKEAPKAEIEARTREMFKLVSARIKP